MRGVEFTTVATAINGIGKSDREVAHEQATLSPRWSIFPYAILDRCCCQIPELGGHLCKIVAPLLGSCRMTGNSEATWVRSRWGRVADNPTGRPQRSLSVSPLKRNAARFRDRAKTFYPAFFRDLFSPRIHPSGRKPHPFSAVCLAPWMLLGHDPPSQHFRISSKIRKVERRALARAMQVTNDILKDEANPVNLLARNHFAL